MRLIFVTGVFLGILSTCVCFAQNDQTESLTITTYYPAPYGVYRNPRLVPGKEPSIGEAGTMYFNDTDKQLYIFNGTVWNKFGSGVSSSGGSGLKIDSDHFVSPDQCSDATYTIDGIIQICDYSGWYKHITFKTAFTAPPDVIAVQERNPDPINSPCVENMSAGFNLYVEGITNAGFDLEAGGAIRDNCKCASYSGKRSHVQVGWIAIGK